MVSLIPHLRPLPSTAGSDREDDGQDTFLPPFANAENRALDSAIRAKERQLEDIEGDAEENADRVTVMQEHLRNVNQEVQFTQSRAGAKAKELETEEHMFRLSELAVNRIREDAKKMEKEEVALNDKMTTLQTQLHLGGEKLDQFKLTMNWNQEELEQWAEASRQKEEDNLALEKYKRADDARVRELNLAIEKMTMAVNAKREALENEVTDTQAAQLELDRAAEDFRALHSERQDLVRQWEDTIETMKRRDQAIQEASRTFAARRKEIRMKQAALEERRRFLEQEVANNKELDAAINVSDRGMAKLREEYNAELAEQRELSDEVDLAKNTLARVAADLVQTDAGNDAKMANLEEKRRRLEKTRKKLDKAKRRLEDEKLELMTLEERSAELARINKDNEDEYASAQKEVVAHKDLLLRTKNELYQLRERERDLTAEIQGGQSQNKNMTQRILQLDAQVIRQQENLYNAEFQIQALERKIARADGLRSDEETRVLQQKIDAIQGVLDERVAERDMLTASVKRAEDDLDEARKKNAQLKATSGKLTEEIGELNLEAELTQKDLRKAVTEKEDKMISHETLKLEVKKLRDALNARAEQVFELENRKYQLQLSMEERKHEVETHRELLAAQLKMVQEDIHRATLEMKERSMKVGRLQNKFEILVKRVKRPDGDGDGEERSQAYYIIKAAQEREEMQRRGDALDAKIRKAEKEVRALEATLAKLNIQNDNFRTTLRKVSDDDDALGERATLREKLDHAYDKMKFRREEEQSLERDLERADAKLRSLHDEAGALNLSLDHLESAAVKSEETLRKTAEEAEETHKALVEAQDDYRASRGIPLDGDRVGLEELDLRCQEMREGTRVVISELKAVAAEHPELSALLASYGVKLPGTATEA